MPSRNRLNKVTKPSAAGGARRGSRQSSLSNAAQEQLEQFAQQAANSEVNHETPRIDASIAEHDVDEQDLANSVNLAAETMLANGESITSLHPALHPLSSADEFLDHQMHDHSSPEDGAAVVNRTAADVAYETYGNLIKIDSALCKKIASENALREPTQRRHDQKLNIERRSNVEALLAHMTGQPAARPCKNCHKGHGPWTQCVVYDGQMCGSCTNCWFNASGSRCTFHENNHPQPSALYTGSSTGASYQPAPIPPLAPVNVSIASEINQWGLTDPTKQLINHAITEVATFSRRDRFLARIEAAAKELGMRIAEYEEFLRTPEGIVEQNAAIERDQGLSSQNPTQEPDHTQPTEASMADIEPTSDDVLN